MTIAVLLLSTADVSGHVRQLNPRTLGLVQQLGGQGNAFYALAFSPDGKRLAAASAQGAIHIYNARSWAKEFELEGHPGGSWAIAFSPDGKRLASGGQEGLVKLWDVEGRKEIRQVGRHTGMVWGMAFSPDGRRLATTGIDGTTRLWDPDKGEEKAALQGTHPNCKAVFFTPDSSTLMVATGDGRMKKHSAKDGSAQGEFETEGRTIVAGALSRDGRSMFGAAADGTLHAWDPGSGRKLAELTSQSRGQQVMAMAMSPEGRYLIVGDSTKLKIYDTRTHRREATLHSHRSMIYALAVAPGGHAIVSASGEGALIVWAHKPGARTSGARGYLGVTVQTPDAGAGCELQQVLEGFPAEKAGLRVGDRLLKVGGAPINSFEEAVEAIGGRRPGEEVEFIIERDGKEQKLKIKLAAHPEDTEE
jgi:WD40 repeat protein